MTEPKIPVETQISILFAVATDRDSKRDLVRKAAAYCVAHEIDGALSEGAVQRRVQFMARRMEQRPDRERPHRERPPYGATVRRYRRQFGQ